MEAGIFDLDDRSVRSVENDLDDSSDTDNADRGDYRDAEADAVTDVEPPPYSNPPEGYKLFTYEYTSLDDIMEDLYEFAYSVRFSVIKKQPSNYLKKDGFSLTRYNIECNKGPIRKPEVYSRQTLTAKKNCP